MSHDPPHLFTQTYQLSSELLAKEQRVVDGHAAAMLQRPAFQARTGLVSLACKRGFGLGLRWSMWLVMLSPLLCVAQAIEQRGYPVVAFVGVVCLFFGMLNLYLLASAVHWLRTRHAQPGPPFDRLPRELSAPRPVRIEGVARALDGGSPAILFADLWDDEEKKRVAFGDDFFVEVEGDEPLVVRIETSVPLFGRVERLATPSLPTAVRRLLGVGGDDEGFRGVAIRPGDRVVVHSIREPSRIGPLESFELGRRRRSARREQSSAYRDGSSGKLLEQDPAMSLAIEVR